MEKNCLTRSNGIDLIDQYYILITTQKGQIQSELLDRMILKKFNRLLRIIKNQCASIWKID